jgi:hypothetical protein
VELSIDGHLTLRGDIQAATFGNCLLVEPHRQGYTQDFHFKIDKALRERGLLKAHITEWHSLGVVHKVDGSLLLDNKRIKSPNVDASGRGERESEITETGLQPQEQEYRECSRCQKPAAKLKCACLATHYCDTQRQRQDMLDHRQMCTHMILKEITISQSQLKKPQESHEVFTVEVANLETLLAALHIENGDSLRTSKNGTNYEQSEHHYRQALQILTGLVGKALLNQRPSLLQSDHLPLSLVLLACSETETRIEKPWSI